MSYFMTINCKQEHHQVSKITIIRTHHTIFPKIDLSFTDITDWFVDSPLLPTKNFPIVFKFVQGFCKRSEKDFRCIYIVYLRFVLNCFPYLFDSFVPFGEKQFIQYERSECCHRLYQKVDGKRQ